MTRHVLVILAGVLATLPALAADRASGPDLGFDHHALVLEHMKLVADGKGAAALAVLAKRTVTAETFSDDFNDSVKRKFALIYGSAGKSLGHEVVGYKHVTPRLIKFFAVSHYEKASVLFRFAFLQVEGEWKLQMYSVSDSLDDLERLIPLVAVPRRP